MEIVIIIVFILLNGVFVMFEIVLILVCKSSLFNDICYGSFIVCIVLKFVNDLDKFLFII